MKGLDKKKKRDPEAELDDALQKARGRGEAEEPVESPLRAILQFNIIYQYKPVLTLV